MAAATATLVPSCTTNDPITRSNAAHASASQITRDSRAALASLYARNAAARSLAKGAKGIFVFPAITRAGFVFGGQAGNGVMFRNDESIVGFYQTTAASYGLQIGVQKFSYALFLMDDESVQKVNRSGGWDIGSSPSLVIVNRGMAGSLNTTNINKGTYAFFFNQQGLMAGLDLQGSKITPISPRR
ncbi:MAG: lipid-binding SYLF domain-containing protein [Verrucomicrobia bacterium]|nr:lipid-binding SYLF domain-containing protein [Verrucomicrobiota bacterium]